MKRKFAQVVVLQKRVPGKTHRIEATLQGVGQSAEERDAMIVQATNGTRKLHVVEKQTAAGPWYGIYTVHGGEPIMGGR